MMAKYAVYAVIVALVAGSSFYLEPRWAKAVQYLAMGLFWAGVAAAILEAGIRQSVRWTWGAAAICAFAAISMLESAHGLAFDFEHAALAATPSCMQDVNKAALLEIEPDAKLRDVVWALRGSVELHTRAGTVIDTGRLPKIDYGSIQPVTLTQTVDGERLQIIFGPQQEITSAACTQA